jgi:hypothetical protein
LFVARIAHLRRPERDLSELVQPLLLLLVQEFRVTDDVNEENMPDLEAKIIVGFRHGLSLPEAIARRRSISYGLTRGYGSKEYEKERGAFNSSAN